MGVELEHQGFRSGLAGVSGASPRARGQGEARLTAGPGPAVALSDPSPCCRSHSWRCLLAGFSMLPSCLQ